MSVIPPPPSCGRCDDHYEPHDADHQGYCTFSCWYEDQFAHMSNERRLEET